ncbi:GNAT family N-acetyltransferase [Paenibacillus sambharensis]|uniref:GNAT family N-acetyltransferase n=2 Tax=Paenibacillus sambharensis TaxID=1803190 RepID=A0A2W1LRG9_9BACL|nr:GNAT family N-acetyltransferase [Paenibacillus sambharensis]
MDLCLLYEELVHRKTDFNRMVDVFRSIQNNDNYVILGAFKDNQLIGSLMGIICQDLVGECKPFMVIENVIVSRLARRQGGGQKLMAEIERIAKDRDCYYIILVSGGQRKDAHEFYARLGYKEEEVQGYRKHIYK